MSKARTVILSLSLPFSLLAVEPYRDMVRGMVMDIDQDTYKTWDGLYLLSLSRSRSRSLSLNTHTNTYINDTYVYTHIHK
jgi:hypothetical protein